MKWMYNEETEEKLRRSPCGERGLKSLHGQRVQIILESLPVRGAWVEIFAPPSGRFRTGSLPVRGAWVEICVCGGISYTLLSLPVRGAWVEILRLFAAFNLIIRRSPCGERGLK